MYTQNANSKSAEIFVKSFPNKDSIYQMETLKTKEMNSENQQTIQANSSKITTETSNEILLMFGLLLCLPETEKIKPDMFMILSGIILSL